MTVHLQVFSLAQRPDLVSAYVNMDVPWPAFVKPTLLLVEWGIDAHDAHQLILLDGDSPVARAAALPLNWDGDPETLPLRGWDGVIEQSATDTYTGAPLNTLCALEVGVSAGHEGRGLSRLALNAVREHARAASFDHLIVPVRPSDKIEHPDTPIADYIERRRDDGLPVDNWLRVHERLGGRIIALSPTAMTITAPLHTWQAWTGHAFSQTGLTVVDGGIAPVFANVEHDYAIYVEPNVWVEHPLSGPPDAKGPRP